MKIKIINNNLQTDEILKMTGSYAAICYSSKKYDDFKDEDEKNIKIAKHCIKNGHHSIFDHIMITLNIEGIPKILAMMLNNIEFYNTSEKSGRYTKFKGYLYEKWIDKFKHIILNSDRVENHVKEDLKLVEKLAMENARYFLDIFHETNMIYTISVRQVSYLYYSMIKLSNFIKDKYSNNFIGGGYTNDNYEYLKMLICDFTKELENSIPFINDLCIEPKDGNDYLFNKINFFNKDIVKEYDGTEIINDDDLSYTIKYEASLACIAQLQRHRTTTLFIDLEDVFYNEYEVYIPEILYYSLNCEEYEKEYIEDMKSINYIPIAALSKVIEIGTPNAYKIKSLERLCSRAQLEVCRNVQSASRDINNFAFCKPDEYNVYAKCKNFKCQEPCKYGINGLKRYI